MYTKILNTKKISCIFHCKFHCTIELSFPLKIKFTYWNYCCLPLQNTHLTFLCLWGFLPTFLAFSFPRRCLSTMIGSRSITWGASGPHDVFWVIVAVTSVPFSLTGCWLPFTSICLGMTCAIWPFGSHTVTHCAWLWTLALALLPIAWLCPS